MISALPTWFNGTLYRSRLEASWAEFFHINKYNFQYEPQGFKGHGGKLYLCDFLVELRPKDWMWIEVKPTLDFDPAKIVDFVCSICDLPDDCGYPNGGGMLIFVGKPDRAQIVSAIAGNIEEDCGMWPQGRKQVRFMVGPSRIQFCKGCSAYRVNNGWGNCVCGTSERRKMEFGERWDVRVPEHA